MIDTIIYYLPHAACLFLGGIVGFFTCAMMTMSKVADAARDKDCWHTLTSTVCELEDELVETEDAHARATDRGNTLQARIDRALAQITPGANATVVRIGRILRGEG